MESEGFLVVLRRPGDLLPTNPRYRGLYRAPPYPSDDPAEQAVLEDYVFGSYTNEEAFIPDLTLARELLQRFKAKSKRAFEIIYAKSGDLSDLRPPISGATFLGFDVACDAPFWSIVADFPIELSTYLERLNEYGLFDRLEDAQEYLQAYHDYGFDDDSPDLKPWAVFLIDEG